MTLTPSRQRSRITFAAILILTVLVLIQVGGIMRRIRIRQVLSPDRLQQEQPNVSGIMSGGEREGDQDVPEITETSLFKQTFFPGHRPPSPSASRSGGKFPAAESGQTQASPSQSARGTGCSMLTESGGVLGNSTMGANDLLSRWTDLAVIQDIIRSAASLPRGQTPRIFHFVWVSPRLSGAPPDECIVPASVVRTLGMWHEKHPSWDIILWTDPTVRAHFPELSDSLLSKISIPAWISDIVRFAALVEVGGVYFDTDTLPLLNIQDVVEEHSPFTVCAMNPKEWARGPKLDSMVLVNGNHACRIVANGAVAAPPTDLTVSEMYRNIVGKSQLWISRGQNSTGAFAKFTGPPKWTKIVREYGNMTVMNTKHFLPCPQMRHRKSFQDQQTVVDRCNLTKYILDNDWMGHPVYTMHLWTGSWIP